MSAGHRRERVDTVRDGAANTRRLRRLLLSTGVICVLMLRLCWVELAWVGLGWFGFVWVELLGCRVAGGRDVWLSQVGVGSGVELWRSLWCLLCFIVSCVLCAGCLFGIVVSRGPSRA